MRTQRARKLIGALFLGAASVALVGLLPSPSATAQVRITNPELAAPIQAAQAAAAANNYTDAIAEMRKADAIAGNSREETVFIHQTILAYATQARQYQLALTTVEGMIASNEGNRNQNLRTALQLSLLLNNTAKAETYAGQLGETGNMAIYLAQAQYSSGAYQQAIRTATPLIQGGGRPPKAALDVLSAAYFKVPDLVGQRRILELVALHYPSQEAWGSLIGNVHRSQRGLTDEQELDILRLRLLTGNLTTVAEYSEMAQLAILAGFPGEAKSVLDAAAEAGVLEGDRSQRLIAMTEERVAQDQAEGAALVQQAAADPTGNSDLKLGGMFLGYGRAADAEGAIRRALEKGRLTDAAAAQMALGRALLAQDKGNEAVAAFNQVAADSSYSAIARMWSIYARQ